MKSNESQVRTVVVTGGAGYLGGTMARVLLRRGYRVIALDDFSTSARVTPTGFELYEIDLSDWTALSQLWPKLGAVYGVIHFAARALVGESCEFPDLYFRNNLLCTLNMARICVEAGTTNFIHSSSCTVYGIPRAVPITEDSPLCPISPYGASKRAGEEILHHFAANKRLKVVNLRYFNPAGSLNCGEWGESHEPESHLIPSVVSAARQRKPIRVFGADYETPDGTCIRDFIHVEDLMGAHLAALEYVDSEHGSCCFPINVGSGRGYSVYEVIHAVAKVTGLSLAPCVEPRRPGDPPKLVADVREAVRRLGWRSALSLEDMISSHLKWEETRDKIGSRPL